jgi:hypothetical protein
MFFLLGPIVIFKSRKTLRNTLWFRVKKLNEYPNGVKNLHNHSKKKHSKK